MTYAQRVKSVIDMIGETVVYRRISVAAMNTTTLNLTNTYTDTTAKASIRTYREKELGGLVQQGDREARISADSLTAEPRPNDKLIISGKQYNIVAVNTRKPADTAAIYILQVRS